MSAPPPTRPRCLKHGLRIIAAEQCCFQYRRLEIPLSVRERRKVKRCGTERVGDVIPPSETSEELGNPPRTLRIKQSMLKEIPNAFFAKDGPPGDRMSMNSQVEDRRIQRGWILLRPRQNVNFCQVLSRQIARQTARAQPCPTVVRGVGFANEKHNWLHRHNNQRFPWPRR